MVLLLTTTAVLAQAPAASAPTDPDLLYDLFGTVNTLELQLPTEVTHLHLLAQRGHDTVLAADAPVPDGARRATVTAGALSELADCPLTTFLRIELRRDTGDPARRALTRTCLDIDQGSSVMTTRDVRLSRPGPLPELPLDTWLVLEATGLINGARDADALEDDLVFYLHLTTRTEAPGPPDYDTWTHARNALP